MHTEKTGVCFIYSPNTINRQIPSVNDVLDALWFAEEKENDPLSQKDREVYINRNVYLAALAASFEVRGMRSSEEELERIIARTIIDLCPEKARCHSDSAYVEAKRLVGDKDVPSPNASPDSLVYGCPCKNCRETIRLRALSTD